MIVRPSLTERKFAALTGNTYFSSITMRVNRSGLTAGSMREGKSTTHITREQPTETNQQIHAKNDSFMLVVASSAMGPRSQMMQQVTPVAAPPSIGTRNQGKQRRKRSVQSSIRRTDPTCPDVPDVKYFHIT